MKKLLFVCMLFLSCAKAFKEKNVCQPIKPEDNGLIKDEQFYGDRSGNITNLVASPFATMYYTMFLSENTQQPTEYFQLVVGGQVGQIDSSKIRAAGTFRYEFGEFTTDGFRKNNLYLPDFFIPHDIVVISEGSRKGDVIIQGYFFNIITMPYNFNAHIFIYNHNTKELTDLYKSPYSYIGGICYKGLSNSGHEIIYAETTRVYLLKLSDQSDSYETTVIGDVNFHTTNLKFIQNNNAEFLFAHAGYYNLTDDYSYANLYKIELNNGGIGHIFPLSLSAGNQSTGSLFINKSYVFWATTEVNRDVKTYGSYGATFTYKNSVLKKTLISSIDDNDVVESCRVDNSEIFCDSDFKFHVDEKKNPNFKISWTQSSGDIVADNTHFWGIGSMSVKDYTYEEDDETLEKTIGVASIQSSSQSGGDCKTFTFGEKDAFCEFNCAAIVGDYLYVGGKATSGKAWLVKLSLADLK